MRPRFQVSHDGRNTPRDGYKDLMIGVLVTQIEDYILARDIFGKTFPKIKRRTPLNPTGRPKKGSNIKKRGPLTKEERKEKERRRFLTRGEAAKEYIFENDSESDNYVFGLNFICRYIGLDPERLRKRLKELRAERLGDLIYGKSRKGASL